MQTKADLASKADPLLWRALQEATGDEILRVLLLIEPLSDEVKLDGSAGEKGPAPSTSRSAYRRALIERETRRLSDKLSETMEALQKLSLRPRGGRTSRTVVIEGPANAIARSLDLPSVRHASLDREVTLIEPRRRPQ